jgi:PST family polysaccharide transporter
MAAAVLAFFELFRDLGLSTTTIQRPKITHAEVSTLFWINIAVCVLVLLAILALAPALASFYRHPDLARITIWLGIAIAIGGLSTQHIAILRRQMRFAALAAIEIGAAAISILTAVVVAGAGNGVWALVAQRLAWSIALTVSSWALCRWRPGRPTRAIPLRALLGFGGNVTLSSMLNMAARSLDQVLIGWWAGAFALGLYERANKLLMAPIRNVNAPLFAVAMPMLSRLAPYPARYRRAYLRALEAICMVTMPASALLIAAPDWVVSLLLGQQWADAAPIVMWIGVSALVQPATNTTGWLFMSQDRTGEMVRWNMIGSALKLAAIVAGLRFGPVGVAAALAVTGLLIRAPLLFWMVGRTGPVSAADLYGAIGPSAMAAAVVFGTVWLLHNAAPVPPGGSLLHLALAVGVAAAGALLSFVGLPRGRRAQRHLRTVKSAFFKPGIAP